MIALDQLSEFRTFAVIAPHSGGRDSAMPKAHGDGRSSDVLFDVRQREKRSRCSSANWTEYPMTTSARTGRDTNEKSPRNLTNRNMRTRLSDRAQSEITKPRWGGVLGILLYSNQAHNKKIGPPSFLSSIKSMGPSLPPVLQSVQNCRHLVVMNLEVCS